MCRRRALRSLGILALSFSMSAALATASPSARPKAHATPVTSASGWGGAGEWLADSWRKAGCFLGVGALCVPAGGAPSNLEHGCGADPDGIPRCTSLNEVQPSSEHGCGADPNGICQ